MQTENAWHPCTAQVHMILHCQEHTDAQSAAHP
ncbi:Rz1-like lysis system protein LysC [Edwardsiella ictaluri]|nr:Rz1-like lysis system protein LysC [Edwardsiella ictaluri]UCQ52749.1 Rz1-like lysis system protein LysC [Edwardsiella ictaluri]